VSVTGRLLLALFAALLFSSSAFGADRTPEDVIRAFFGKDDLSGKEDWFAGEIESTPKGPKTLGQDLPPGVTIALRRLQQSSDQAVYAVVLTLKGQSLDWYAYLSRKSGDWQFEAERALALPGLIGMQYAHLRDKGSRTAEEEWTFRNLDLTGQSDELLKSYFATHRDKLEDIKDHFVKQGDDARLTEKTKTLHIQEVQLSDAGNIEIVIGGFMDNFVGYMFVPEGKSPPPIDRSGYIMIDQIADHWYLFKTT
jgi:hypothetical protein